MGGEGNRPVFGYTQRVISETIDLANPPYVGPVPFTRKETLYGRDREAQDLTGLLISERIVLLYSPSGAGKSSLVEAKVIPELERREFMVRPVLRVSRDLPDAQGNRYLNSLARSLQPEDEPSPGLPAGVSFEQFLGQLATERHDGELARDEVLIFDQFEEILTLDPTDIAAKREFFQQVGRALLDRGRWALFSMREDYVAALDPFLRFVPTRLSSTYRLDLLGERAAAQAISGPAKARGVSFEPVAVARLVDDLRRIQVQGPDGKAVEQPGPYVEPVQLQVVCLRLWREWAAKRAPDSLTITEADLGAVDNVGDALRAYYDERVADTAAAVPEGESAPPPPQLAARERAVREWFDRHLITPEGIRGQVLQGFQTTEGLANSDIRRLVNAYLVRSERRGGRTWYELAHDRLIRPVRASNDQWRRERLVPAQMQAGVWEAQGRPTGLLLRGEALLAAASWAVRDDVVVTPLEHEFLDACQELARTEARERRRNRLIRALAVVATLGAIVAATLAVLATIARNEASARELAGLSTQALSTSAPRALLLAAEAMQRTAPLPPLPETISAMQQALAESGGTPLPGFAGRVLAVAISPTGDRVAASGEDGSVRLWATADLAAPPLLLVGHSDYVNTVAFSPDGRLLASASDDATARVWDLGQPDAAPLILPGDAPLSRLAFSPDGAWLVTGDSAGAILARPTASLEAPPRSLAGHSDAITALLFSADGRRLASASADTTARIWDLANLDAPALLLEGHTDQLSALAFSPDGATLATGAQDSSIRLWDAATGADQGVLVGQGSAVFALAFSPDGTTLASGGLDGKILLWSLPSDSDTPPQSLVGHTTAVVALDFSADGGTLRSASADSTLRLWSLAFGAAGQIVLRGHEGPLEALATGANLIATASDDGSVRVWPSERLGPVAWLRGPQNQILTVSFAPEGQALTAGAADASSTRWALAAPLPPETLVASTGQAHKLAATPDGRLLVGANNDGQLQLWDLSQPAAAPVLIGQAAARILAVAISPDGRRVATSDDAGALLLYDAANPGPPQTLPAQTTPITKLAFQPGGQLLAAGDADGAVRLWNLAQPDAAAPAQSGSVFQITALAFSPDGAALASGDTSGAVRLWQVGRELRAGLVLRGHDGTVQALAFSPDSSTLATASIDTTARLWDLRRPTSDPVVLSGQGASLSSVAFSPDGALLATGDSLGRVRLWPVHSDGLAATACAVAGRNLQLDEWQRAFGPAPYRKTCANLLVSPTLIDAAAELASFGELGAAAALAQRARALGVVEELPARSWGRLCRAASLGDGAAAVGNACDAAIALDPEDGLLYDWRALNRARTNNLAGAAADLELYLAWARATGRDETQIALREGWAAALATGADPYDETVLQTLSAEGDN